MIHAEITKPTKIRIGALDYKIIYEPDDWEPRNRLFGQIEPDYQIIHISDRIEGSRLICVFMHEVAHGFAALREIYDGCKGGEEIANLASYDLVMFFKDNPNVFDWYIKLVKGAEE